MSLSTQSLPVFSSLGQEFSYYSAIHKLTSDSLFISVNTQHFLNSLMMDSGEMSFQALLVYFPSSASYTISASEAVHCIPYILTKHCIIYHIYFPSNASFTISTTKAMHHIPYLLPEHCFIYHFYFPSNASYTISPYQAMHHIPYLLTKQCVIYYIYFPSNVSYTMSISQAIHHIPYVI